MENTMIVSCLHLAPRGDRHLPTWVDPVTVSVASAIIAALSLTWGITSWLAARKVAKVVYDVTQFSDFDLPPAFLRDIKAPIAINVQSVGNKAAENIRLHINTNSRVIKHEHRFDECFVVAENELRAASGKMNPGEDAYLFLFADGLPNEDQITSLRITHTEGEAIAIRRSKGDATIKLELPFIALQYDFARAATTLIRLGPFRF
jgi:hypothetical protein